MTDLKPCPFCGGKARAGYVTFGSQGNWSIVCTKNDKHRMEFLGTKREVIEEWNRRVVE